MFDTTKYTIRRHLGKGEHFGYFQIRGHITDSKQGDIIEFVNPNTHSLIFENCILHNKLNQSKKIFAGANKQPCAYIICGSYKVVESQQPSKTEIKYNPKTSPNWIESTDDLNSIVDSKHFNKIFTSKTKLYV